MNFITGTIYDDTIQGTGNPEVLDANAGDDTINGLGGNDVLIGGPGSGLIMGGEGDDTVHAFPYTSGNWQDYLVVAIPGGFVLADKLGSIASDEVSGVEFFYFANGTFAVGVLPNLADAPVITITADRASQTEGTGGATALTFTVRLDRPADASLSVLVEATSMRSYAYDPDRTVFPGDLVGGSYPSERLVFAPGEVSKTFTVRLAGDDAIENDEKLTVYLRDPLGPQAVLGRQSVATMMVLDDDGPEVNIFAAASAQNEGDAGTTPFHFRVELDTPATTSRTVRATVEGVGANPASAADFAGGQLPTGDVVFLPGEMSKTFTVHIAGDLASELHERFRVALSDPSSGLAVGPNATATAIIFNDDIPVVRGTEGGDTFVGAPEHHSYDGLGGRDALDIGGVGFRGGVEVVAQPDGSVVLVHGGDMDVVRGIEEVRFADGRLVFNAEDPAARVIRLYEAALDRLPDQDGLNFWIDALQSGQPLAGLASGFLGSNEFASRIGDVSNNDAFVDRLYGNVLARAGEADGRAFWAASLQAGASRADVLVAFSESDENKAGTATLVQNGIWDRSEEAAEVARLYDTVFGRKPDTQGLAFWKGALEDNGATLAQMADAFTDSAEFRMQYGGLGNREFADAMYRNTLDRSADQAGLDYWVGQLDAGAARSAVALAFSESREHAALTADDIQSENPGQYGILFV